MKRLIDFEDEELARELASKRQLTTTVNWLLNCYKKAIELAKKYRLSEYEATTITILLRILKDL